MRMVGRNGLSVCALSLATAVALTVPDLVLGASRSVGRSAGRVSPAPVHRQRPVPRPFISPGVIAVEGDSEPQIIIIQPPPPAPVASESTEPAASKIYVAPRWVDGGHGVQVMEPGHWVESKQPAKR